MVIYLHGQQNYYYFVTRWIKNDTSTLYNSAMCRVFRIKATLLVDNYSIWLLDTLSAEHTRNAVASVLCCSAIKLCQESTGFPQCVVVLSANSLYLIVSSSPLLLSINVWSNNTPRWLLYSNTLQHEAFLLTLELNFTRLWPTFNGLEAVSF